MAVTWKPRAGRLPSAGGSATSTSEAASTAAASRRLLDRGPASSTTVPAAAATSVTGRARATAPDRCWNRSATASTTAAPGPARANPHAPTSTLTSTAAVARNAIVAASTAAGTATRLAGTLASRSSPKVTSSTGSTASWAPSVTDSSVATRRGNRVGSRSRTAGATSRTPAVALADRTRPSEPASRGSRSTSRSTVAASACRASRTWPRAPARSTSSAMVPARSTLGSRRVRKANQGTTTATATRWLVGPNRSSPDSATTPAMTMATLVPLTAVRWVSEVACIAAWSASGRSRRSPVTKPTSRPAVGGSRWRVAAVRIRSRHHSVARAAQRPSSSGRTTTGSSTVRACWEASQRP